MFKKAERKQVKIKLAIIGPSGSGKTHSALRMATGMGGKIAVIDTENGSASMYSDKFNFDVVDLNPPYTVAKYQEAIEAAEKAGYEIIIIDSISHAWAGEGGLLEQKEALDQRGKGNSFTNWSAITKQHEAFKNHFLHSPCHIICTIRSKQEYQMAENNGKSVPKKVGMAPIQRENLEYEFSVVLDVAMNHEAEVSKDRTGLFEGKGFFKITEEIGSNLMQWMNSGKEQAPVKRDQVDSKPKGSFTPTPKTQTPPQYFIENKANQSASKILFGPYRDKTLADIDPNELDAYLIKSNKDIVDGKRDKPAWFVEMERVCYDYINAVLATKKDESNPPDISKDEVPF